VLSQLYRILDRDRRIFHFSPITHPPNRFNWSFQLAFFTDTHSVDRKKFNEVASTRRCESTYKVGALSETAVVTGYRVLSFRFLSGPVRNLFRTISRKATPAIESRREHKPQTRRTKRHELYRTTLSARPSLVTRRRVTATYFLGYRRNTSVRRKTTMCGVITKLKFWRQLIRRPSMRKTFYGHRSSSYRCRTPVK